MKYADFKALNMFRQAEYLAGHGRLLAERREDSFRLQLFAVADFYAEQWCESDNGHLLFIHLFRHPAGLRDYLPAIRLPRDL